MCPLVRPETGLCRAGVPLEAFPKFRDVIADFKAGGAEKRRGRAGFRRAYISMARTAICWDQFLQDSTNHRNDVYGRRNRKPRPLLMLEVADACIDVWGADRVGMHLAPRMERATTWATATGWARSAMSRPRAGPAQAWAGIAGARSPHGTGYQTGGQPGPARAKIRAQEDSISPAIKQGVRRTLSSPNEGFDPGRLRKKALAEGFADAVAFGKLFIANPDLPPAIQGACAR